MAEDRDISHWYDRDDNALDAELECVLHKDWKQQADFLGPRFREAGCKSLLEFGPGPARLAQALGELFPDLAYLGVDKSRKFVDRAQDRMEALKLGLAFVHGDVRTWGGASFDCVCAFKFLKHFALDEWDDVLAKMLDKATHAAFDVQLHVYGLDNGTDWPHTFVRVEDVQNVLAASGHEEVDREVWGEGDVPGAGRMQNVALWTRRRG